LALWVVNDIGLVVEHHLGPGDTPLKVDAGDHVERRRRIARSRDDIEGRKHISRNFVALIDGDRRRRPFLRAEPFGAARIDDRHHLGCEPFAQLALFCTDW
jgi:hypothetical protein